MEKALFSPLCWGPVFLGGVGALCPVPQSRGKQSQALGGAALQHCWVLRDSSRFRFAEQKNVSCKELFKLYCTNGREQNGKTGVEG